MPYKVKKVDGGWQVVNKDTGKTYKKTPHKTKKAAQDQMAALYVHTKNEDMMPEPMMLTITDIADELPEADEESDVIYYGVDDEHNGHDKHDHCKMLVRNLKNIKEDAQFICECVNQGCEVEEWMKHKLSICYAYLNDIADSLSSKQ